MSAGKRKSKKVELSLSLPCTPLQRRPELGLNSRCVTLDLPGRGASPSSLIPFLLSTSSPGGWSTLVVALHWPLPSSASSLPHLTLPRSSLPLSPRSSRSLTSSTLRSSSSTSSAHTSRGRSRGGMKEWTFPVSTSTTSPVGVARDGPGMARNSGKGERRLPFLLSSLHLALISSGAETNSG